MLIEKETKEPKTYFRILLKKRKKKQRKNEFRIAWELKPSRTVPTGGQIFSGNY